MTAAPHGRMDPTEVQDLLRRLQAAPTSGENLESDPEFLELERIGWRSWDRLGDASTSRRPPDWNDVLQRCNALFARTVDFRLAVVLLRAALRVRGCSTLPSLLQLLDVLVTLHWDRAYPERDPEGDPDDWRRRSVLAALADPSTVLADLRASTPWQVVAGVTVRDVELASGSDAALAGEAVMPYDEVCEGLRRAEPAPGELRKLLEIDAGALTLARSIEKQVGNTLDLRPLLAITGTLSRVVRDVLRGAADADGEVVSEEAGAVLSPEQKARALAHVRDVVGWLAASELQERFPALVERAQRLEGLDKLPARLRARSDADEAR